MKSFGFVYILANEAMPGIYKVGTTDYSPRRRAAELSSAEVLPTPYSVVLYGEVEGATAWEAVIHQALVDRRISDAGDFFRGPLIDIIRAVEGDGELDSIWNSDEAKESRQPGCMDRQNPLWFEKHLYAPGYLERLRRGQP